jgi:hypothetical protein
MIRILKWLGLGVAGLVVAALLLCAVVWLINLRDEALTPQAQALLQPPPDPYKAEDNLYLALAGSDAPSGEPVIAAGQAKVDYYNQRLDAVLRDPSRDVPDGLTFNDPRRLEFKGNCNFVQPLDSSVWNEAPQHRAQIERLLADNRELYQRYLALHPLRGYCETARPSVLTPHFDWPSETRKLFLADLALRMHAGISAQQSRDALTALENDVQMWRAVLRGQGSLLSKTVASLSLQGDYFIVADMIADPHVAMPLRAEDADSLVPATDLKDWDIGNALAAEFRVSSSLLRQTDELSSKGWVPEGEVRSGVKGWRNRLSSRTVGHLLKLNATENLFAAQTARQIQAAADPVTYYRTQNESPPALRLGYNPVGKILAAVAYSSGDNYVLRAWGAAALQRLVRLSYEIRRQGIDAAGIPAFLEQHPEVATHPADRRPFIWDPQRAEIRIQTVAQQQPGRRFSIRIWQPEAPVP